MDRRITFQQIKFAVYKIVSHFTEVSSSILIHCKWLIHFESAFAFQKYANPPGKLYIKGIHFDTMGWYTIAVYMPGWWFQAVCFHTH